MQLSRIARLGILQHDKPASVIPPPLASRRFDVPFAYFPPAIMVSVLVSHRSIIFAVRGGPPDDCPWLCGMEG